MLKGGSVEKRWQPMSAETWNLPLSFSITFIAEKTGRSGQPTQKPGGRTGSPAPRREHRLLDMRGLPFLDNQDALLAPREIDDLFRNQRIRHVQAVDRHARRAERIGHAEELEGAHHRVVQAALADDADVASLA